MDERPTAADCASESSGVGDAELLARFLADRDVACPRCAYNLRTLRGDRCTECGVELRLSVSPVEPFLRPWIASMVFASLGAGVGLLFIVVLIAEREAPPAEFFWVIGLSWACIPIALSMIFIRRRYTLWPRPIQWILVTALAAVLIVMLAGFGRAFH